MRRIEFVSKTRIGRETFEEGDRKSFLPEEAQMYIDAGWAKDPETGEQGDRVPGCNGPLRPATVTQAV